MAHNFVVVSFSLWRHEVSKNVTDVLSRNMMTVFVFSLCRARSTFVKVVTTLTEASGNVPS